MLFGSNGISNTISTQSDMCLYTQVLHNIETLAGQKKKEEKKKLGQQAKVIPLHAILVKHALGSPAPTYSMRLTCLAQGI